MKIKIENELYNLLSDLKKQNSVEWNSVKAPLLRL